MFSLSYKYKLNLSCSIILVIRYLLELLVSLLRRQNCLTQLFSRAFSLGQFLSSIKVGFRFSWRNCIKSFISVKTAHMNMHLTIRNKQVSHVRTHNLWNMKMTQTLVWGNECPQNLRYGTLTRTRLYTSEQKQSINLILPLFLWTSSWRQARRILSQFSDIHPKQCYNDAFNVIYYKSS